MTERTKINVNLDRRAINVNLQKRQINSQLGYRDLVINQVTGVFRIEKDFTFEDVVDGYLDLGNIPADKRVYDTVLIISTAFDGTTTITIGDIVAQARLMSIAQNDPSNANVYSVEGHVEYSALTLLKMFFSGTPTAGEGTAIIYYS